MSFQNTHQSIRDHFESEWGSRTPVDYGEEESFPKPDTPWARLTILDNTETRAAVGEEYFRAPGIVVVQLFTKPFYEAAKRNELLDHAAAVFRSKHLSNIHFYDITPSRLGVSDGWHQINLNVSFEADHLY